MALLQKFWCFSEDLAEKRHNLSADDLRVALSDTEPNAATGTNLASIAEIAAGNGYPAGGLLAPIVSSAQAGGTYKLVLGDVVITAAGGPLGPFRYFILQCHRRPGHRLGRPWGVRQHRRRRNLHLECRSGYRRPADWIGERIWPNTQSARQTRC
jgi:hypothetical protein